ncbi:peptidoglycan editing factor PgeF [Vibrio brasiliensis]|uniref:peptidoglycan editing factor PgeF n=1 Tax=Vibrio brasiliensis TaxID=170652 RepID=UPI001EFC3F7C|nr:peptidoglycan editing factor PgeF [Vibrio brasiliensis]MCG9727364.1 peptidoglycan editing factor PgeF [Vibrio brasiliensis]
MDIVIPNWPAAKHVKAFSSTRGDGFSVGAYQGLNLGSHVGDESDIVDKNRQWLADNRAMPSAPVWLNQTHSTVVEYIDSPTSAILDADGTFTDKEAVVCSAMTADCLPVLLTNTQGTQVAAVHAGWRGLANGIVENAVEKLEGELMAWIGPAIGAKVFEVGQDVVDAFTQTDPQAIEAFQPRDEQGKWLADMNLLVTQRLRRVGVEHVYYSNLCTYADPERFYSYRRDGITGRQATFIWIEK